MNLNISPLDCAVVLAYFVAVSAIAWHSRSHGEGSRDFLIGERHIPWWAAMLSIIGTEMSALTFVGVPAFMFAEGGNYTYLMGAVGMIAARLIVSKWFVPAYYRYDVVSIYELLERRFGPNTRSLAVLVFMFTRVAMSGVRLYAGSLVLETALGVHWRTAILVTASVGLIYTVLGGIRSVIWTEVMQVCVMFGGTLVALFLLYSALPHGWSDVVSATAGMNKFRLFDWGFDPLDPNQEFTVWAALFGLTFFNLSIFGTDYDMVQRMLTTADAKRSARAVVVSALADVPLSATFLTIGLLLFTYYHLYPDPTLPVENGVVVAKQVFPHFILTRIPHGLAGLVVAGILSVALSSFQSALNSLSASYTVDVYKRHVAPDLADSHYVSVTRWAILGFAVLMCMVAFWSSQAENILILGLEIPSYTYCALLGVFLAAICTRRGTDRSCTIAMLLTFPFVLFCHFFVGVAWTWNALLGTACSFGIAAGLEEARG